MKKVRVGIIDSGINPSALTGNVIIRKIGSEEENRDLIGHGTMCAYLIEKYANIPLEFYSYKIFERELVARKKIFVEALKEAVDDEVDILNLSLSVRKSSDEFIYEMFDNLEARGTEIIAATANSGENTLVDRREDIYTVAGESLFDGFTFRKNGSYVIGDREPVLAKWYDHEYDFIGGNSKATALYAAERCRTLYGDGSLRRKNKEIRPAFKNHNFEMRTEEMQILKTVSEYTKVSVADLLTEDKWENFGDAFLDALVRLLQDKFGDELLDKITIFYESLRNAHSYLALEKEIDLCIS